ncbi:hypothetical protein, partial [Planomonospora parontospora]|uniref:hypothetical protein n=2 Tax=Planomonospora parontospora TaxID=58119 RepID=UPI001E4F51AA
STCRNSQVDSRDHGLTTRPWAKTVLFMAMCVTDRPSVALDEVLVPVMQLAVSIGGHVRAGGLTSAAARCGLTLLTAHAIACAQHTLALAAGDAALADRIQPVIDALWPATATARPPGPVSIRAALALHRHRCLFGDSGVPYLAELVTLGTASATPTVAGGTFAAALRALLHRITTPGHAVARDRFARALLTAVRRLITEADPQVRHISLAEEDPDVRAHHR